MVELAEQQVLIDGSPVFIISGEIHYFRLSPKDWSDRIQKAKHAGCNCIASYIPWLVHEESRGELDLTGRLRPENDLGSFIDLCKKHGLWFIARPGPFTMGEIKNEGIPDWVYQVCPTAIPITWDGKTCTSRTLNYLDPDFLKEVRSWYQSVGQILAPRMQPVGGNIIALQLDNEIGMLQCWTEEADLSDSTLCAFAEWVHKNRKQNWIKDVYPFDFDDPFERAQALRKGDFATARGYHTDYTEFTRDRFAHYADTLRGFAAESGIIGVPYVINIHGSGGGRATTFPIGISQVNKAYAQSDQFCASSDHYLGEITRQNVQDLYFLNAFMRATSRPNQPLSSIEFEAGTGNYGENGAVRYSGAATDFKARISAFQGNRMLNHYLLAGGVNPPLIHDKLDGNSRVGTTGGRHGFAAPISPEGELDPVFHELLDTNKVLMAHREFFATCQEITDAVAIGFIPDYYSTDVKRQGPMRELAGKLERSRGFLESMTRSFLDIGLRFSAINLQQPIQFTGTLAVATASVMPAEIQKRLLNFVEAGGSLFLYGQLPNETLEGRSCTILTDALKIQFMDQLEGSPTSFPSLKGMGIVADSPEVRIWNCQLFDSKLAKVMFAPVHGVGLATASFLVGRGKVIFSTTELPLHMKTWRSMMRFLGQKNFSDTTELGGVVYQVAESEAGKAVSIVNLDGFRKSVFIREMNRKVNLPARQALLLPIELRIGNFRCISGSTEVCDRSENTLTLRKLVHASRFEVESPVKVVSGTAAVTDSGATSTIHIGPGSGTIVIGK